MSLPTTNSRGEERQGNCRLTPTNHRVQRHRCNPANMSLHNTCWDQRAEILENRNNRQSYLVQINGRGYLRNRRFLRPLPNPQHTRPAEIPQTYQKTGGNGTRKPKRTYQKREFKPTGPLRWPQPIEQNATPIKIYPQRIRQQRMHYQAAVPKPKRRNRPTAY